MKKFKTHKFGTNFFNRKPLVVSIFAVAMAVVLSFSAMFNSQKGSNGSLSLPNLIQSLNLYSFQDKNTYWDNAHPLVESTELTNNEVSVDLMDIIVPKTLSNNGYFSDNTAIDPAAYDLTTTDYVWAASTSELTAAGKELYGDQNYGKRSSPTDFAFANYAYRTDTVAPDSHKYRAGHYWTRTSYDYNYRMYYANNGDGYSTCYLYDTAADRPLMQFDLDKIFIAQNELNFKVEVAEKTITFPNIMFPQTKVYQSSDLEYDLNSAYNNGDLSDGMELTERVYIGFNTAMGGGYGTYDSREYKYNGNYYVRKRVYKRSGSFFDGSAPSNDTYIWIKVEPIVWYITNWNSMPTSINPNGNGTASTIIAMSQKILNCSGRYYLSDSGTYGSMWQNSRIRAYYNGYDLYEQNNGTNGNKTFRSWYQANFKGYGFLDTIWHSDVQQKTDPVADFIDNSSNPLITNNYITAKTFSTSYRYYDDVTTTDYAWLPMGDSELQGMLKNIFGAYTNDTRKATPTDFTVANYGAVNTNYRSQYDYYQGTTNYWIREVYYYGTEYLYYAQTDGAWTYTYPLYNTNAGQRPIMQFNVANILADAATLDFTVDTDAKTITFPNIMFPQNRADSNVEESLEEAYQANVLRATGRKYVGGFNGNNNRIYHTEYFYEDNYYVRTYVYKYSDGYRFADGTYVKNDEYMWVKVDPIVWYITNWSTMPTSINPEGTGTATQMIVLSQYVLNSLGCGSELYGGLYSMWQNTASRAYLNGYNLAEQNNGTNGRADYATAIKSNYKGNGFIDVLWHELYVGIDEPPLPEPEEEEEPEEGEEGEEGGEGTEINFVENDPNALITKGYIKAKTLNNSEYFNINTINTTDYVWIGTTTEYDNIFRNVLSVSNDYRKVIVSDFALCNYSFFTTSYAGAYYPRVNSGAFPTRTPYNRDYTYYEREDGVWTYRVLNVDDLVIRPIMQFDISKILEDKELLNFEVDVSNKTIVFPNVMFPQTKVDRKTAEKLDIEFEKLEDDPEHPERAKIKETGLIYKGYMRNANTVDHVEYFFENNYYVRTYAYKKNAGYAFKDSTTTNGTYIWIKVEPIQWYIGNWPDMPTSINPNGNGTATEMTVMSRYGLNNMGYYSRNTGGNYAMWQNTTVRAYLNGYDLAEQNDGSNGNASYKTPVVENFKDVGFVNTLWHTVYEGLEEETNQDESLKTTDSVFIPYYDSSLSSALIKQLGEFTDIRLLLADDNISRKATPSDYVISNNVYVDNNYHSLYNLQQGCSPYWLRYVSSMNASYAVNAAGRFEKYWCSDADNVAIRPVLQINAEKIVNGIAELNIQVDAYNKTIVIPNMMYPQTKVKTGSQLEAELNLAYNETGAILLNGLVSTGKYYSGYDTNYLEYFYKGNYYVRSAVIKNNSTIRFSEELHPKAEVVNSGFAWFKVEPIVWYIPNWDNLPTEINPDGDGTATSILVISQEAIVTTGHYCSFTTDIGNDSMWQNSTARAYLNGYNLSEQNNNTNGNSSYVSDYQANFKNKGFIDSVWHDLQEYTLVDVLEETQVRNDVFTSANQQTNIQTNDFIYVPTKSELTSYFATAQERIVTPTDYALANRATLNEGQHSTYDYSQGSTLYWLRSEETSKIMNYVDSYGNYASSNPQHTHNASILALNISVVNLLSSNIQYIIDAENKTIVFPNIMYPQTKVEEGSQLEANLNAAYSSPTATNRIYKTGKAYAGLTIWEGSVPTTIYNQEYFFDGNYYVRTYVAKYDSSYAFSDGDSSTTNGSYIWIKVEPIKWNVTNWNDLPSAITNGATSGSALVISCLSQYAIVSIGSYYPNASDSYGACWQNSVLRAFLNGYDLAEQNTGLNGAVAYSATIKASFKGLGFVDTVWHAYVGDL